MKMSALANASIHQLALIDLRIEPCEVVACHEYVMKPAPIERFVYIQSGKAHFYMEKTELFAGDRDMIYLPGETAYHSKWLADSKFMVIDLLLHDADGQQIHFEDKPSVLFCDVHGAYIGLLEELAAKAESNGPFDWLERVSLSFKLLCEMARDTNRTALDAHNRKIKAGLNYLENNFCSDFAIEELAEMCCLSVGSFRRSFSECMGMSPVEYRNKLRIQKAVLLLKTGQYTVGEAAEMVGIKDIGYFGKLFKRYTSVTPGRIKEYK